MSININNMTFTVDTDTSQFGNGALRFSCAPEDDSVSEFLVRIVIRNMTRFVTIYTEQFDNIAPGQIVPAFFSPESAVKNSRFNIIVQIKATLNNDNEEIIQRDFFVNTEEYVTTANITTKNVLIRYNTVHNSYFITGEAILSYSGYEDLRIRCTIRDALNELLLENHINYVFDPNNIHRLVIRQDFGELNFPSSWYLQNPCKVRLSYEYL